MQRCTQRETKTTHRRLSKQAHKRSQDLASRPAFLLICGNSGVDRVAASDGERLIVLRLDREREVTGHNGDIIAIAYGVD